MKKFLIREKRWERKKIVFVVKRVADAGISQMTVLNSAMEESVLLISATKTLVKSPKR